jgi:hypothetical protein
VADGAKSGHEDAESKNFIDYLMAGPDPTAIDAREPDFALYGTRRENLRSSNIPKTFGHLEARSTSDKRGLDCRGCKWTSELHGNVVHSVTR